MQLIQKYFMRSLVTPSLQQIKRSSVINVKPISYIYKRRMKIPSGCLAILATILSTVVVAIDFHGSTKLKLNRNFAAKLSSGKQLTSDFVFT